MGRTKKRKQSNPVNSGAHPFQPGSAPHQLRAEPKGPGKSQKARRSLNPGGAQIGKGWRKKEP